MYVSSDDAAVIYARFCHAWYGNRAPVIVTHRIRELQRAGDLGGVRAWTRVADKLPNSTRNRKVRHRGKNGKLY